VSSHDRADVRALDVARRIGAPNAPVILDVRTRAEFRGGHVPGALHVPFWRLLFGVPAAVPRGSDVIVYCGHGPRARFARAMLRAHGIGQVACLAGHMAGWRRAGLPEDRRS
jgi:rhodanese-related sulfurtransferase